MKITFVTYHNWETKRIGGFHKFAEGCALAGHEVVFFSFERPYYIYFKKEERLNKKVLRELSKGKQFIVSDGTRSGVILNCTWPTIRIPMPFARMVPESVVDKSARQSITPFKKFQHSFLDGTDVFVLEKVGVPIFDLLKEYNDKARFVYRPSDPIMVDGVSEKEKIQESYVLKNCDLALLVNQEGLDLYKSKMPDFEETVNFEILSNGVDTAKFKEKYPAPSLFDKGNIALYVGALAPEWELTLKIAEACPEINVVIVCPEECPQKIKSTNLSNFFYIPGIYPTEVPAWITNCDVFIVPYPTGMYKIKPWGITAKYYQAMTARKPIVVYDDTDELRKYGISVSHDYDSFIASIKEAVRYKHEIDYHLGDKDWASINKVFINKIKSII